MSTWRRQREVAELAALAPQKRGPKFDPARADALQIAQLTRERDKLQVQLDKANLVIAVQKKVAALLALLEQDNKPESNSCELIDRRSWQTKIEARLALFTYIEGWYNPRRRHSALGQISPAKFERSHQDKPHAQPSRLEHDLTTVGACVACATSPVDKSAQELTDTRTPRGGLENMRAGAQCRGAIMEGRRSSRPERQKRCVSRANS